MPKRPHLCSSQLGDLVEEAFPLWRFLQIEELANVPLLPVFRFEPEVKLE